MERYNPATDAIDLGPWPKATTCEEEYERKPYQVLCPDGVRRHEHPFATYDEALEWMEWSHTCESVPRHHVTCWGDSE